MNTPAHDATTRACDHDRDHTLQLLGDALAEGALDTAEYHRRAEHALTATTHGDLTRLTADLPPSKAAHQRAKAAKARQDAREWTREWGYWAAGALVMTTIWAVTALRKGEWPFYWPAAPLAIWAAILISYALWPSPDEPTTHNPDTRP